MFFDLDHWQEILQSLRRNPLRTFLTACGVFWGVFMLVVMLGFGRGLEKAVTGDMSNWAQNTIFIWSENTSKPFAGRQSGRRVILTTDDAEQIATRVPGVELALARNHLGGRGFSNQVCHKDKCQGFAISGEHAEYQQLENFVMERGRFLNQPDLEERRKVVVIGTYVAETLFPAGEDPVGQSVRVGSVAFKVVGVYRSPGGGNRSDRRNGRVFVPRSTFARTFGTGNRVDYLTILVEGDRKSTEVEQRITAFLRARHMIHPDDLRALRSFNREKEFAKIGNLFLGISTLTWVVGVMTLLAGAIGVSNIMMISVAERTREIGIRKAIGATPGSIITQIVQESTLLTMLAGYVGLVAGVGVLEIVGRVVDSMPPGKGFQIFSRPDLDIGKALAATAILTLAGGFAGLAPARTAVAIRPIEALAHE